jgi:hypothetical protein
VAAFRKYFSQEKHRDDVAETTVADVMAVDERVWLRYIRKEPIKAWVGKKTQRPSAYFEWHQERGEFRYIGPVPSDLTLEAHFVRAVRDRVNARLDTYWTRPGPGRMVFDVIPPKDGKSTKGARAQRSVCIMFGKHRKGLPTGWHLVAINGRHLYGRFEKSLNELRSQPGDAGSEPNLLSDELRRLFGGSLPARPRVRLVRQSGAAVWEVWRV